ncbi:thiamine-phosphate kinase [Arcanobacterium buesumense]|uniref:Thiamine-monophosphate kinase n=1 Tax=Arcanobacterium buesumense TaxID=2722751 RepID=A0A6H2ELN0_9ACTO|nr:thiamine-phosphate kinase [Arcanobacterium buesumense]QJC21972.1 thiamine-phosphate kinase [Arcanobacterium buesumense]
MLVKDLNEKELLARFVPLLPQATCVVVGNGDDSAVLHIGGDTTVSTDMLVENRHFRCDWSTGFDVGYRAAQQNIADALAMGATPVSLVVGLGLPPTTEVTWVEDLARGFAQACQPWEVGVDGGDLVSASEITIGVTVIGDLQGRKPLRRDNALPGQKVIFTGNLGHAAAGYELLKHGYTRTDSDEYLASLIDDFLRPKPPIGAVMAAVNAHTLCAGIDVSDGLVKDIGRVAQSSRVWINLDGAQLNKLLGRLGRAAGRLGTDRRLWALAGGEDHGFVATIDSATVIPDGFSVIGQVMGPDEYGRVTLDQLPLDPDQIGWDHFRSA